MAKQKVEQTIHDEDIVIPGEVVGTVDEFTTEEDVVVKKEEVKEQAPKKKGKATYWRNKNYSACTILVRGGKDELGGEGVEERARFTPYYDTFKGDVIRVGYLETDSAKVAKRCEEDLYCEELSEKEYNEAVKELRRAPIPQA